MRDPNTWWHYAPVSAQISVCHRVANWSIQKLDSFILMIEADDRYGEDRCCPHCRQIVTTAEPLDGSYPHPLVEG